jgi:hypothetical protein
MNSSSHVVPKARTRRQVSNIFWRLSSLDSGVISLPAEANEAESIIAALLAAAASGTISNVTTSRAWTGAEFKAVAEKAAGRG